MSRTALDRQLRELEPFLSCSSRELRALAPLVDVTGAEAGEVLMRQGDDGHGVHVIVSGTATVVRDGHEVARLSRGDVVGEVSMLVDVPRTATVVASSPMTLATFAPGSFAQLLDECPTVAHSVLRTAIKRLAAA
jgi:CRP/FNR family transcriptional regulator, cyclic AMP receptor protein